MRYSVYYTENTKEYTPVFSKYNRDKRRKVKSANKRPKRTKIN